MTLMLLAFWILGASMSDSVSHPSFQMCPNCKLADRQVQRYRGMRERVWETSFKNGKVLEDISAKETVEKEVLEQISAKEGIGEKEFGEKEIGEKELPTGSLISNMWQELWSKQNASPER